MKPNKRVQAQLNEKLQLWWQWCPAGTHVVYRELQDGPVTLIAKTRSEPEILSGHTVVVWLEGKTGCVCVDHCEVIRRFITPEQEAGLAPAGWTWEQYGGMVNCFPHLTSWNYENPEANTQWVAKGFTAPRELFFQTPLQKAAPDLLQCLKWMVALYEAKPGLSSGPEYCASLAAIARATGPQVKQ